MSETYMIPTCYEEEFMQYTVKEKLDKRLGYCQWCKDMKTYRIYEKEYKVEKNGVEFTFYALKPYCCKCEGRIIVPWVIAENLMRLRHGYEKAHAATQEPDGGQKA